MNKGMAKVKQMQALTFQAILPSETGFVFVWFCLFIGIPED